MEFKTSESVEFTVKKKKKYDHQNLDTDKE